MINGRFCSTYSYNIYVFVLLQYKGNFPLHDAARANDVRGVIRLAERKDINALNEVISKLHVTTHTHTHTRTHARSHNLVCYMNNMRAF